MARMSKPSSIRKGKDLNKEELSRREEIEKRLMGSDDNVENIPEHLQEEEQIYYKWVVSELKETGVLTNIDIPLIEQVAHCIHIMRLCSDEISMNGILVDGADKYGNPIPKENPAIKIELNYMSKYGQLCNQLGLSPSARANLASKKIEKKEEEQDPLLQALKDLKG